MSVLDIAVKMEEIEVRTGNMGGGTPEQGQGFAHGMACPGQASGIAAGAGGVARICRSALSGASPRSGPIRRLYSSYKTKP